MAPACISRVEIPLIHHPRLTAIAVGMPSMECSVCVVSPITGRFVGRLGVTGHQRSSTRKVGTFDPPPAVTFNSGSVAMRVRHPAITLPSNEKWRGIQHAFAESERCFLPVSAGQIPRWARSRVPAQCSGAAKCNLRMASLPLGIVTDRPAEYDAFATVFVVGLEHQSLTILARELQQVHETRYRCCRGRALPFGDHARPRYMRPQLLPVPRESSRFSCCFIADHCERSPSCAALLHRKGFTIHTAPSRTARTDGDHQCHNDAPRVRQSARACRSSVDFAARLH